jgi:error-prone DNA polymerase
VTRLAEADCFAALGVDRRTALWAARAISGEKPLPLFAGDIDGEGIVEPRVQFRTMTEGEQVVEDYIAMRLTLKTHPLALLRPWLTPQAA